MDPKFLGKKVRASSQEQSDHGSALFAILSASFGQITVCSN